MNDVARQEQWKIDTWPLQAKLHEIDVGMAIFVAAQPKRVGSTSAFGSHFQRTNRECCRRLGRVGGVNGGR